MIPSRKRLVAAAFVAAALCGCGYRFATGGAALPDGISRVYVPVFENRSTDAEAGALFAEALAASLARQGKAGGPGAPAQVVGTVLSISAAPAATGPRGRDVGVYRLAADLRLRLVRGGQVLCEREFSGGEDYLPGTDLLGTEGSRRQATRRLAERLMRSASAELCPVIAGE